MLESAPKSVLAIIRRLSVGAFVLCAFEVVAFANGNTFGDVDGLLARTETLVSGRLHYTIEQGFSNQDGSVSAHEYMLLFQGASWYLSELGVNLQREKASHNSKSVDYQSQLQPDGTMLGSVRVYDGSRILNDTQPYHPTCSGTIWFTQTIEYIRKNEDNLQDKGQKTINDVACTVLEWSVSPDDRYEAFSSINSLNHDGGILRVFVAPQFGYALPRVEHLSPDGKLAASFDSSDFREYSGVFLPRKSRYQIYLPDGTPSFFVEHKISSISDVNEPIADDEFSVAIREGTTISDQRGEGGAKIFEAHSGMMPEDISDVIVLERAHRASVGRAVYIGVGIGTLLLVVLIATRKPWHRWRTG